MYTFLEIENTDNTAQQSAEVFHVQSTDRLADRDRQYQQHCTIISGDVPLTEYRPSCWSYSLFCDICTALLDVVFLWVCFIVYVVLLSRGEYHIYSEAGQNLIGIYRVQYLHRRLLNWRCFIAIWQSSRKWKTWITNDGSSKYYSEM